LNKYFLVESNVRVGPYLHKFSNFYEIYLKKLFQNKRKTGKLFNEIINEEEDENFIQPEKIKNSLIIEILKRFFRN